MKLIASCESNRNKSRRIHNEALEVNQSVVTKNSCMYNIVNRKHNKDDGAEIPFTSLEPLQVVDKYLSYDSYFVSSKVQEKC